MKLHEKLDTFSSSVKRKKKQYSREPKFLEDNRAVWTADDSTWLFIYLYYALVCFIFFLFFFSIICCLLSSPVFFFLSILFVVYFCFNCVSRLRNVEFKQLISFFFFGSPTYCFLRFFFVHFTEYFITYTFTVYIAQTYCFFVIKRIVSHSCHRSCQFYWFPNCRIARNVILVNG